MAETFEPIESYGLTPEEYEEMQAEEPELLIEDEETDWLGVARDAFDNSDDFFASSLRNQIEKNIDAFNSRYSSSSKYHQPSYKYRSKIYRPKTRSMIRRHEAAAAAAYFNTKNVVTCTADDQSDEMAVLGAEIAENLVNTRLQEPNLKWFATCIGAYQDAMVQGAVISRQEWEYKEERKPADPERVEQMLASAVGAADIAKAMAYEQQGETEILEDRPRIDLVPIENFRFDPAADWRDPISSSPYLIEMIPMYRQDVEERMRVSDPKTGQPPWNELSEEELSSGNQTGKDDSTRQRRNDGREDSKDQQYSTSAFDIIWVHRNVIRIDGEDWLFYTLGTTALLSDPVPLEEVYPHGRPYCMGFANLETHKTVPAATVEMTSGLQQEINEIVNQRLDNVKLVVNRRSFVRRNSNVDPRSLTQSVPGGVTLVDDVDKDVRYDAPPDVTSSSYAEQDRLNNDFDELSGSFSGSSVASNRAMNETVGGMQLMTEDANNITEYQLKIFSETWVKPVLRQMLELERFYESDERRLQSAANGADSNTAVKALRQDFSLNLSIGFGATNPQKQIEKLAFGLSTVGKFAPQLATKLDEEAILSEVFGALGYQDGSRFFKLDGVDPQVAELQQQLQQMKQQLESKQMEQQTKLQIEQMKQQGQTQREESKNRLTWEIERLKQEIEYIDQQIDAEQNDIKRGELIVQRDAFEFSRKQKELEYAIAERDRMSDVLMRDKYGMAPGIDDQPGRG
jgi:hypothetical protein